MRTEAKALQIGNYRGRGDSSKRRGKAVIAIAALALLVMLLLLGLSTGAVAAGSVTKEGAVSTGTTATGSSISFAHTTGSGADRLLLVGISMNCGSTDRDILSVTFTPSGGSALPLTEVITQLGYSTSNPRYAAIYRLVAPPSGATGTVTVTFSGGVSNGAIAGAVNFANVDQTTPLGTPAGAASSNNSGTAVTIPMTGLAGTELVFDNVFFGSSDPSSTLTPGAGQTLQWFVNGYTNSSSFNTMAGASTEQASSSSVTMSWTSSDSAWWAVAAVPIRPAGSPPLPVDFSGGELLGQPTNNSMAVKVIPDAAVTLRCQYSTTSGGPYTETSTVAATAGQPATVNMTGLTANTKYYYRVQYTSDGGANWQSRDEHSFWTQRSSGSTFTFDITTDSHIDILLGNESNWEDTLDRVAADRPDFLIDLGDTVAMDNGSSSVALGDTAAAEQVYKDVLPFFNTVSASSPIFLLPGNHEQQEAWHLQGTLANSLPIMGKNAEKKYFLNPAPNAFYSGDSATHAALSGDKLIQDYYSWTWGDALFVVICPYWTTTTKPYTTTVGGGETDAAGSGDRWDWTLGETQFNWLKNTLVNSNAKYKFVFSHQITGSNSLSSPDQVNYGHGGVDAANWCEWGGYNVGTSTWAFEVERAGWGSQPIRQMMEANGVTAFFHGHDHQMAYEKWDDVVYQACPSGSFSGGFGIYNTGGQSGKTIWADSSEGAGYLRVTVSPAETEVEFIRYNGSSAAYTYTMEPAEQSSYDIDLVTGWNLIAATPGTTFPSSLFGWNGSSYDSFTNPASWAGYWCKVGSSQTVAVTPTAGPHTVNLITGWNLIGNSMGETATLTKPAGRSVFVYDPVTKSYESILTLQPGQGAWVKGTSGETVTLTPSS